MKSRKKFTAEFKAKVAIEALKERESITDLAKRYDLHPNQITTWKREFLNKASSVFSEVSASGDKSDDKEKQKLYEVIGQQKVEIDFLKKALS